MTHRQQALLSWAAAAAVLLAGCRGGSRPGSMSGSSGSTGSAVTTQTSGWQTGLGVLTETSDEGRTGTIHTIAAAVLLDGEGKVADVMLDELEVELSADGKGAVTMPTDYRTKRQKGDDYPLAAASSLKKGWAEQADAFADYLTGLTPQQAAARRKWQARILYAGGQGADHPVHAAMPETAYLKCFIAHLLP